MTKTRHILFLQSSSEGYGSGKIILQVLRFYQNQGLSPVVVLTSEGPIQKDLVQLNIPFYVHNLGILRRKYVSPSGLLNRLSKNLKAYRFLSKLHEKYRFELVYSNTLAVVVGAYWAKRNRIPHIWHIHEILLGPRPLRSWLAGLLDSSTFRPIAVSQAVADNWQPLLKRSKIQVIHNGIPYEQFLEAKPTLKKELGLSDSSILIGMIGRINPGKGQFFFIDLADRLSKSFPEVHFVLVGDPFPGYEPILEEVKLEIRNKRLENSVFYLGFREDIPEVMASLDIFVLPSVLPDSFPTVILEAMAAGKPVVATRSGGASEMVVEGETGYLISIGDVEEGFLALEKLIQDQSLREQMGANGRNRTLYSYSLEAFEQKIVNHLWHHLRKS
ncbi:glycosyltransferase family 4 protein [Algoriphagus sp. AK58]|uniref:glycosyltransferase family 4 protein n=1 Tax=Algoriphagus sp. AK58 TaxID=1406877 RepID=UPI00164FBC5B|nr:glycosyltransferase family 4 protein [Algoriphagus sp. AK58]MBC6365724.1 glycosyltransferase family 1 protein [Algoriphagus sp. AK58]